MAHDVARARHLDRDGAAAFRAHVFDDVALGGGGEATEVHRAPEPADGAVGGDVLLRVRKDRHRAGRTGGLDRVAVEVDHDVVGVDRRATPPNGSETESDVFRQ